MKILPSALWHFLFSAIVDLAPIDAEQRHRIYLPNVFALVLIGFSLAGHPHDLLIGLCLLIAFFDKVLVVWALKPGPKPPAA